MSAVSGDEPLRVSRSSGLVESSADAASRGGEHITHAKLLVALGVAVYMTDAAGVITEYNDEAAELWGRRPEVGKDAWCGSLRLYSPDGTPLPHGECPMAITLKENRATRGGEAIAERPDGTRVYFLAYPSPLRDGAGTLIGAVNVLVDITALKAAEQALRRNETALNEALAIKDEFLALASHELRTPLTSILGNARVLARLRDAADVHMRAGALDDIIEAGARLERIIANLLLLARAEQGAALEREPVLVIRIVQEVVVRHQQLYPGRTFEVEEESTPRPVSFPEGYLDQVIENLVTNAEKYSPPDEPITIQIERSAAEVRVRVLDRGPGIDDDEGDRLFQPFYRTEGARRRAAGLGIGLSVCKRLVETQGGCIWARARPGGGSEFGFALPVL